MDRKIFCIGFHKTGTTSLRQALEVLGLDVTGPNGVNDPDIAEKAVSMAFELVDEFDAFQDNPWPIIYKELDEKFPGSLFILTSRNTEKWIKSQVRHFGLKETPMRRWIYGVGCPEGNEDVYVRRYEQHYREVASYFSDRPDDLLVLDLSEGECWEKLCPFLGLPIPDVPFPHANNRSGRKKKEPLSKRLVRKLFK